MASSITSYGTISSASEKLFYEQEGNKSGPAVLFIHGLGGTTNTYQPLVSKLQDFNLVRFDWAGHGRSSTPKSTSIESYAEDALAVIKHFGLKDVTVVGHSLGCLVAMTLAAKHPTLVTKLVLFGPIKSPPQPGKDGAKARAENVRAGGMAKVADTVVGNAFAANSLKNRTEIVSFAREMLTRQDPEGYALACQSLANSVDPEWKDVKAAVTIVSGAEDKVAAPAVCEAIKRLLVGVKSLDFVTWENVGHWHTLENTVEAVEVVKKAVEA